MIDDIQLARGAPAYEIDPTDGLIHNLPLPKKANFGLRHPNLVRLAGVAVILGLWQIVGERMNPIFLSDPEAVSKAFWVLLKNGSLIDALGQTMGGLALGFSIGVLAGLLVGVLIGRVRLAYYALDPILTAFYNTTILALIGLVEVWFGLGLQAKVFFVVLSAFFSVVFNTYAGVRAANTAHIDVVRAYGGRSRDITAKVVIPSAIPYIMAGIRLAVGRSVLGIVAAEFFTALNGLGGLIVTYQNNFQTAYMWCPVLVLVALGLILTSLAKFVERKVTPWKAD